MLLVLNKYDLVEELQNTGYQLQDFMTEAYMKNFAEEHGFLGAVTTSAKTGQGVTEAVAALVQRILADEM